MRTVLVELRPAALTEMDLADLLRQLAQAATARAPLLEVSVSTEGRRGLPPEVQIVLYRIAQEGLNNIVKHSDAGHADVRLVRRFDGVQLSVSDDGRGFDPALISAAHLGVEIMRERSESIGALLSIDSDPAQGTRLRVVWSDPQPAGLLP